MKNHRVSIILHAASGVTVDVSEPDPEGSPRFRAEMARAALIDGDCPDWIRIHNLSGLSERDAMLQAAFALVEAFDELSDDPATTRSRVSWKEAGD